MTRNAHFCDRVCDLSCHGLHIMLLAEHASNQKLSKIAQQNLQLAKMGLLSICTWQYVQVPSRKPFPKKVDHDVPSSVPFLVEN